MIDTSLIEYFEGLSLKAYPDPATKGEPWTIGYGHTGGVKPGDVCTKEQAQKWLLADCQTALAAIKKYVKPTLTQGQTDALVSIIFNVGIGAKGIRDGIIFLRSGEFSTLIKKLNNNDFSGCADEFLKWNKAAGKPMAGLTTRRSAERKQFLGQAWKQ